jgi:hypothetical protein
MGEIIKMSEPSEREMGSMVFNIKSGVHVVPLEVFANIEDGIIDITDVDDWKEIMVEIIHDWLCFALNHKDQPRA